MGTCTDKCSGAVCPDSGSCVDGKCLPGIENEGGSGGSLLPLPNAGTLSFSGSGGTGGTQSGDGLSGEDGEAAGCACRVGKRPPASQLAWLVAAALGALAIRRRSRSG